MIECADCKNKNYLALACYLNETEKRMGEISICKHKILKFCKKCKLNKVETECSEVHIECNSPVLYYTSM